MTKEETIAFMRKVRRESMKGSYAEEAYDMAIEALKERPTGKWIPCSERLPLHGNRVLVTATHKKLGHTAVDVFRYHGEEYGWENSEFCIVNAWMPLPAPYEVEP